MKFAKPFFAWFALGLIGIVVFALTVDTEVIEVVSEQVPGLPPRLMLMLQPAVLMGLAVAIGVGWSGRAGLKSWLTAKLRGEDMTFPSPVLPLALGVIGGVAISLIDIAFFNLIMPAGEAPDLGAAQPNKLMALTYGGITEELMLRYGLLTLMFWSAAKSFGAPPGRTLGWFLILLVAVVFGLGHLPAMSQITVLTGPVILRTILLNAALGTLFGWLYWRRGLEAAIMAHMASHVGIWIVLGLAG